MVHIGKIIHDLIQEKRLSAKFVAEFMNMSTSNLFTIYKRDEIDIYKLGKFSELLNKNLLEYYISKEVLRNIYTSEFAEYEHEIKELKVANATKDNTINMLSDTVEALKKAVALHEQRSKK